MSKLKTLSDAGQSVWLDFIRRSFLTSGGLKKLVSQGLGGVTSNPTIFEKAIAGSSDYDTALQALLPNHRTVQSVYEALAISDIQMAADDLRKVYEDTHGRDGYVSLEVDPTLAHETEKTIEEARRLYAAVDRPNVMIKVPATQAGIPAIAALIGVGININVTLIFSLENYQQVANAYLEGLETLDKKGPGVKGGHPLNRVASVASFFVSRVDSAVDLQLRDVGNKELLGKIAIANSKLAYRLFQEIFSSSRWQILSRKEARVQRPLWASTSTKNPDYSETLYVDSLIGPHTVNTLPPQTLDAFQSHGMIAPTLTRGVDEAMKQMEKLRNLGISMDKITQKLQDDGVTAFAKSFESLMESIAIKMTKMKNGESQWSFLGDYQAAVDKRMQSVKKNSIVQRLWEMDHTIWKENPREISDRLGWLSSPETMADAVLEIEGVVDNLREAGFERVLLLGMGGSSLAPEVFRKTFGIREGYLDLAVLDSTDPATVMEMHAKCDPHKTIYLVSTKSGGTVETLSFTKYFYNKCLEVVGAANAGSHFIAITDPGSGLESMAKSLKFRKIFLNDPKIGGRYSALSFFGLVPAAMIGVEIALLLERAAIAAEMSKQHLNLNDNSPVELGVIMGELALAGRDKLTLVLSNKISAFGAWLEQLIAESTGKEGNGILPVDGEELLDPSEYRNDRLFVDLRMNGDKTHESALNRLQQAGHPVVRLEHKDLYDLGKSFFCWEIATAISGRILSINPFDQPNVESAKKSAHAALQAYRDLGRLDSTDSVFKVGTISVYDAVQKAKSLSEALSDFIAPNLKQKGHVSYIALQAYVKPSTETDQALQRLRTALQKKYMLATTVGYGPRFLHSTGQLHKGDAGNGLFIQITSADTEDAAIPDQPGMDFSVYTFGVLKSAQAQGDRKALLDEHRRFIRFHLQGGVAAAIETLATSAESL